MITILIIEDNINIRQTTKDILQARWPDCCLLEATNGAEGIEFAILKQPDLILMDGNLPIMTGFQMAQLFRMMPSVASIPLVAITGADPEHPLVIGMRNLCNAYLPKPFTVDDLIGTVEQLLPVGQT